MACTPGINQVTITVQAPPPSKPTVTAISGAARASPQGSVDVQWTQDIAGMVAISDNGTIIQNVNGIVGQQYTTLPNLAVGTHQICIVAV